MIQGNIGVRAGLGEAGEIFLLSWFANTLVPAQEITANLHSAPRASAFFSRDYRTTFMDVTADLCSDEDGLKKFTGFINEHIDCTPKPPLHDTERICGACEY